MRHLRAALLLGLATGAMMALWLHLNQQIWSQRTGLLVLLWALAGFSAALGASLGAALLARLGLARLALAFRALAFVPGFLLAGAGLFLMQYHIMNGGYNLDLAMGAWHFLWRSATHMALFLYSVPRYLLPWMAPAMAVLAYGLLPRPAR